MMDKKKLNIDENSIEADIIDHINEASLENIITTLPVPVENVDVTDNDLEQFLDDDGNGNVRRYYLSSGIRTYSNETQGTIDYSTGQITLNSLNIASISNIRGATSTVVELTVTPNSNDVVPVRDQIVEIDIANSTINVTADSFVGGSADAGVGYTTTSSY